MNRMLMRLGCAVAAISLLPLCAFAQTDAPVIGAGQYHTLAAREDGSVWAWGANFNGALGDGSTTQRNSPVQVAGLSNVVALAGGHLHSIELRQDGTVWTWGYSGHGVLGMGSTGDRTTPVHVSSLSNIVAIAAGRYHNVALANDGTLWTWGANWTGQCGDGTTTARWTPVHLSTLTGVVTIASSPLSDQTIVADANGSVWMWGEYYGNQPAQNTNFNTAVTVGMGFNFRFASKQDGSVWAWGDNNYFQAGNNGAPASLWSPDTVYGLSNVTQIAGGAYHALAVRTNGAVRAWGGSQYGSVGDGTTTPRNRPVELLGLPDAVAVAAGAYHSVALKSDGTVWVCGLNTSGQLGDATTANRWIPQPLAWRAKLPGPPSATITTALPNAAPTNASSLDVNVAYAGTTSAWAAWC